MIGSFSNEMEFCYIRKYKDFNILLVVKLKKYFFRLLNELTVLFPNPNSSIPRNNLIDAYSENIENILKSTQT